MNIIRSERGYPIDLYIKDVFQIEREICFFMNYKPSHSRVKTSLYLFLYVVIYFTYDHHVSKTIR